MIFVFINKNSTSYSLSLSSGLEVKTSKMIFVYFIIGLLGLIYLWFSKRFKHWEERGFMSPPASIPFGNLKGVGTKISNFEAFDMFYKQYKGKAPAIGLYFFASPIIMPIDLELIKNIFIRDFSSFHDRGFYYNKVVFICFKRKAQNICLIFYEIER